MKSVKQSFRNYSASVRIRFATALTFLFVMYGASSLNAQEIWVNYSGHYEDIIIPANTQDKCLTITVIGGDGGKIKRYKTREGGKGALLSARFQIGQNTGQIRPGGTIRFIVGGQGDSYDDTNDSSYRGGGGGGGTGVAYKGPGVDDRWQLLMVAGGGGGGYWSFSEYGPGYPGKKYDPDNVGNGQAGVVEKSSSNIYMGVGAGAFGDSDNTEFFPGGVVGKSHAGWSGGPDSGEPTGGSGYDGGTSLAYSGGWGFGAGGIGPTGNAYGGGGGGYTGGGRGENTGGYGGTSYLNTAMQTSDVYTYERGTTSNPQNGYISYAFTASMPTNSIRFAYNSQKCIHDYAGNTSNGANIQTYNWLATDAQRWYFNALERTIRSKKNVDKCLDLDHSNTANGTNIQLWDCNGTDAQHWVYNGLYKTIHSSVNSDKCLDAANGSTTGADANLQLWDCQYSNNNQKWNIQAATTVSNVSNMKHIIPVSATGFAVHSHTGAESGSNIQLWTKDNTNTAEQWSFDGLAIKMRDHQNLCIDLSQSNTSNGNNIQLYNCNGSNAQKWLYEGMTKSIRSVVNPGKCMQIEKNTDGVYGKRANVDIQDCNGSAVQQFMIQE